MYFEKVVSGGRGQGTGQNVPLKMLFLYVPGGTGSGKNLE